MGTQAVYWGYRDGGDFHGRFRHVRFAVYDTSPPRETFVIFAAQCGELLAE